MSIETNTCTAQSAWQRRYQSGFVDLPGEGSGLSAQERLTQDAMVRSLLRRGLSREQWHAVVAKYSVNEAEVRESIRWLVARVVSPAHHLFKMKAVMAWAVPARSRRLPEGFYVLHSWDNDGTPESTLRRWRGGINRWLGDQIDGAHARVETILEVSGLLER